MLKLRDFELIEGKDITRQTQNSGGLQQQPALPSSGNHQATNTSSDEDESGPVSEEIPGEYKGPMPLGGINLLKKFEAFRPNFKLDPNGERKIGYSHNCDYTQDKCGNIFPPITEEEAIELLKSDLIPFEDCVRENVKYNSLKKRQFGALVAFVYNLGCDYFKKTKLLALLNSGDIRGAADDFGTHVEFQGKSWPGLVKRRAAERKLFCARFACQP